MTGAFNTSLKSCVLVLVALALLSLPFAHRAGAEPVSQEMAQFISMGGSLADICGETGSHTNAGCESCRIVGAMLLPPLAQTATGLEFPKSIMVAGNVTLTPDLSVLYLHPPVRGPPRMMRL